MKLSLLLGIVVCLRVRRWVAVPFLLGCFASALVSQDFASLTITVTDSTDAMVPDASITLINTQRGTIYHQQTPTGGYVIFDALTPGDYSIEIEKTSFQKYQLKSLVLSVRDRKTLVVELKVAEAQATIVDVKDKVDLISNDAAQGVPLQHSYVENIPNNGLSAESLVLMAPGVSSAAGGTGADGGINANGLRSNTNYYTLDGVSMNTAVGGGGGGGRGGGFGGFGGGGAAPGAVSTELISLDAMQEMNVQTSPIAPEFGRSPGAQIAMTSRGGTNDFHGSLYYYFRSQRLEANDWFANSLGLGRGPERENRPGGTVGGPLIKGKTFFFASFDQLSVSAPYTIISDVPAVSTRQATSAPLQPFLNAFPIPNGVALTDGAAQYQAVVSNPAFSQSASLRLDQIINAKNTLFLRYSLSPSSSERRGSEITAANVLTHQSSHSDLFTAGLGTILSSGMVNDLRVNYSRFSSTDYSIMDNFGGAVPLTAADVFPAGVTSLTGSFNLNMLGVAGYSYGGRNVSEQQQYNVVDSVTKVVGNHHGKAGVDIRRILVTTDRLPYSENVSFNGIAANAINGLTANSYALTSGSALNAVVTSSLPAVYPTYLNFSAYAQDTWRLTERATVTYGVRWDVNPAPNARQGEKPFALSGNPVAGVTQNDPIYPTKWWDLAPRIGLAYEVNTKPGYELMFRTGFGVFYDLGYGTTAGAFSGAPYQSVTTVSEVPFPLAPLYLDAPLLPPTRPYGQITTAALALVTPQIQQWNVTLEQHFGSGALLSLGYAGTRGSNLMRNQTSPTYSDAYDIVTEATNGATSSYNGMQMQFRKRLSDRLQMQLSYTWSHSIDTASSDGGGGGGFATLYGGGQQGDSDYDIRQNLSLSGSYRLPAPEKGWFWSPLRHWYVDFVETARTGLPFDLQTISSNASGAVSINGTTVTTETSTNGDVNSTVGLFAQVRPEYNGAYPTWVYNPAVPGGRQLNIEAFDIVTGFEQGNLGRNALRGFGAQQLDMGLRRAIPITERLVLSVAAQAYNISNHPNFANPSPFEGANLASPNFGIVTEMLNQSFGGAVNSLFRSGGPRSIELSVRLRF
ncbi:MAG: carboxypeptidase regulatory-like domain-containing protein [Bryobacteraceae bacterium]